MISVIEIPTDINSSFSLGSSKGPPIIKKQFDSSLEDSSCSTNNLLIESTINSIKSQHMGGDDDYNIDF